MRTRRRQEETPTENDGEAAPGGVGTSAMTTTTTTTSATTATRRMTRSQDCGASRSRSGSPSRVPITTTTTRSEKQQGAEAVRNRAQTEVSTIPRHTRSRSRNHGTVATKESPADAKKNEGALHTRRTTRSQAGSALGTRDANEVSTPTAPRRTMGYDCINVEEDDRSTATDDRSARRKSTRQAVLAKKPEPTTAFVHRLFLEPTMARQARKRRERERQEEERRRSTKETVVKKAPSQSKDNKPESFDNKAIQQSPPRTSLLNDFGIKKKPVLTGMKRLPKTSEEAIAEVPSQVASVAKAPKRKMSAMTPNAISHCRHATFRSQEESWSSIPESAKELLAQADLARRKTKRKKHKKLAASDENTSMHNANTNTKIEPTSPDPTKKVTKAVVVTPSDPELQGENQNRDDAKINEAWVRPISTALDTVAVSNSHQSRNSVVRHRQIAIKFLISAEDVCDIYAGVAVATDLYHLEATPSASVQSLLLHKQAIGIILLTRSLTDQFRKPRFSGGLAHTEPEAKELAKRIIDDIGATFLGNMAVSADQVMALGLTWPETLLVLPILRQICHDIRKKFLIFSNHILSLESEPSSSLTGTAGTA